MAEGGNTWPPPQAATPMAVEQSKTPRSAEEMQDASRTSFNSPQLEPAAKRFCPVSGNELLEEGAIPLTPTDDVIAKSVQMSQRILDAASKNPQLHAELARMGVDPGSASLLAASYGAPNSGNRPPGPSAPANGAARDVTASPPVARQLSGAPATAHAKAPPASLPPLPQPQSAEQKPADTSTVGTALPMSHRGPGACVPQVFHIGDSKAPLSPSTPSAAFARAKQQDIPDTTRKSISFECSPSETPAAPAAQASSTPTTASAFAAAFGPALDQACQQHNSAQQARTHQPASQQDAAASDSTSVTFQAPPAAATQQLQSGAWAAFAPTSAGGAPPAGCTYASTEGAPAPPMAGDHSFQPSGVLSRADFAAMLAESREEINQSTNCTVEKLIAKYDSFNARRFSHIEANVQALSNNIESGLHHLQAQQEAFQKKQQDYDKQLLRLQRMCEASHSPPATAAFVKSERWDALPDESIIRISSEALVKRTAVVESFASLAEGVLEEDTWALRGAQTVDRDWVLQMGGDAGLAKRRRDKFLESLRPTQPGGRWKEAWVQTPTGAWIKLYLNRDKNSKQVASETLLKKVVQVGKAQYPRLDWQLNRKDMCITADWIPVIMCEVFESKAFQLKFNPDFVTEHNIDKQNFKSLVEARYSRRQDGIQWSL